MEPVERGPVRPTTPQPHPQPPTSPTTPTAPRGNRADTCQYEADSSARNERASYDGRMAEAAAEVLRGHQDDRTGCRPRIDANPGFNDKPSPRPPLPEPLPEPGPIPLPPYVHYA